MPHPYEPVRTNRLFSRGFKYSDINWSKWTDVVDAFENRIDEWYLEPVRLLRSQPGQHGAFAALAISCLLIDCLCQFESGKVTSNRTAFIGFVKKKLRHYDRAINPSIEFPKVDSQNCVYETNTAGSIRVRKLSNVSEVLYHVFRCGILHSAHSPLCGVISGMKRRRFSIRKKSLATYSAVGTANSPCPAVVLDPWRLFGDIESYFKKYLSRLRTAKHSTVIRIRFNSKFEDCFGIDVSGAR